MRRWTRRAQGVARLLHWLMLALALAGATGCTPSAGKGVESKIEHRYAAEDPEFLRNMGSLVEPGILASNKIVTLVNGAQFFPAMLQAIQEAKRSICLETYIYWSGDIGRQFTDALMERAKAGVKVHVI